MNIEIISDITDVEVIAVGRSVRDRERLIRDYGRGRWRKLKGTAIVRLANGASRRAELHWYEASGIGRVEYKFKRYVEE